MVHLGIYGNIHLCAVKAKAQLQKTNSKMISCVCESEHCMPTSVQIEGVKSFLSRKATAYDESVSTEGSKGKTRGKGYSGVCVCVFSETALCGVSLE